MNTLDKVVWLNQAQAVAVVEQSHGPRPTTNYSGPVACPWCGTVHRPGAAPRARDRLWCMVCLDEGHAELLMGQHEMRWRAEVWRAQGYGRMAERLGEIADTLGGV